jgi:hypothetical protein
LYAFKIFRVRCDIPDTFNVGLHRWRRIEV